MGRTVEQLRVDPGAPLPLHYAAAVSRAVELRESDPVVFTWATIAAVIRAYHGFDRSSTWWRRELRGRVKPLPRGVPYESERGVAA